MSPVRVVYFGTPAYAVPALEALAADERFDISLVVTQPDRPAGRGHRLIAPPVKEAAAKMGLPVYQPASLRTPEARQPLVDADADLFIVAAFGLIFGEKTLAIPHYGAVNLHASLLPAYRGANPIAAAIASGDERTGVSLMVMEKGLDSGPVLASRSIPIKAEDTAESLTAKLGEIGAELLLDEIGGYLDGSTQPTPQASESVTFARPMRKNDGEIDWSRPADIVERHIRAMWPWPRAWTKLGEVTVQVHAADLAELERRGEETPGTLVVDGGEVLIACGEGALRLVTLQFPGKSAVSARAALAGGQLASGMRFENAPRDREPLVTRLTSGSATTA